MIRENKPDWWQSKRALIEVKCGSAILPDCVGVLSAVAPCETYSLGSRMIKVQISRIMCSQLERADHLASKSYMWNTMTQLVLGSKVSLPKSSDEKQDKYQAAVDQKDQN